MPDIKEVIDMMVADGRPESEIIALIDRYNKDNEVGKTDDSAIADPIAESNVMDSGSESGSLEQSKELSTFDKLAKKARKYTPSFLLANKPEQLALKQVEKLQEEKIEKERVASDDYIKDTESFTSFMKDDFLVDEDYLKEKLGTDNLAAIDLKQNIGDLTKVVRKDLGIAGMFGTDTRTQYPNLTNKDIDGIIRNEFFNKVKNQKLEIAERNKSNGIQSIIDAGGDIGDEVSGVVDLDIASFDNPIERQLGAINKELRTEGLAPEKIKELTDKQQELVSELNKPKKIIGRQGQIIEVKNEFKFFYNPVTGKSSEEKTEDSIDNTDKTQTYITEYSTTADKLEDYYNDNVLQGIGYKKEGEKTYDIKVGNEAFSGILRNMGYKDEKGVYKDISISDMARFAHLFDDEGIGSGKKFMAESQIEAVNTDDFTSPEDLADYLLVYQEQGRDIAAKKSALKEVYILNKDITSIKKKPIQRHFEAASESIIGPRATESNFGYSNRKILDNIEEITADASIPLDEDQKKYLERSIGDEINEGVGGAYGVLAALAGANKIQGTVLGVTRLGRFMSTLAAPRYVKNGKIISQSKLVKQAAKEGKIFDDLAAGYKKIGPSIMNKFTGLVLAGTMEEVKMQAVGFDPGVGAGFMLGAKALPFKFNTKYNQLNTLLDYQLKKAPAFVLGTNFGELTKGAIEDIANEREYSSFLEEHYGDLSKFARKTIVDYTLGGIFASTHLKRADLKRTQDIARTKNEAMSEMIKGYKQGNMEHVAKYQEVYSASKNRLDAMDKIDLYTNPATAKKAYEKQLKPLVEAFKTKGKDLQVEVTSQELVDGRNAEYIRAQGGQPGKIRINTKKAKPGLVPHEAVHATFDLLFEGNATVKAKFLNNIKNVTKGLKLESGESLYDAILREKSIKDVEKVEEMFAYTTEFLSRAENYTQFVSNNAFSNIRNTIEGFAERQGISKPELKTQQQLVNFLGRYVETIQKGYNPVKQLERFNEIIDISEASVKNQQAVGSRELNPNKSKDYFLNDQRIFEDSKIETPLYSLDKRMFNPDGTKKYNTKEEFQRSEDFMNFFEEVSRVLDVNHNFARNNVIENLVKQDGQKAGVDVNADYINKVKDKLIVRTYNFDPKKAGGSLFGYFKNTAVPKEGLRIRTEEFEKTQEEGYKVELDKPTAKDAKKIEIEAEKSWTEKEFENEDLSISAQLRHREYLEKTGLTVEEAEAYLPTGRGIDVAKNLKIKEPTIDLSNYDFTTVADPKKSATYKNIGKQAIKQIGEYVYTEYYNIKKELFDIMKDTPSKNLNNPARTSVRTKIAKDVETHLKLKPQGAQELISKEGDILTPEWMRGHKNLATGLETIIEQNPLLYTKSSRTGKNLENYIMTPELIKYQKLGKVREGTPEAEFKADFERRYLESIGIIDGKPVYNEKGLLDSKAQVKGRDYDQLLKAIMAQTTKAIHNQSVRKAINADPILAEMAGAKELLNQIAAGKSGAIASKELGLDKVYRTHLLKVNENKMMQNVSSFMRDPLAFKKSNPKEHAAIKDFVELQTKYEAEIGQKEEIKFTKEAKKLPYEWAQNGSWKISSAKFKNDIKLVEEFKDNSFDLADIIPLKLNNTLGNAKMLVDLFTGHYGVIRGIKQYDKVNSPFKKGIRERLVNGKNSKLSSELQARWQNFNWDKLKSSYASQFYTGLAKVYQQKGLEAQKTEARKFIGSENGKLQIELYDLWNSTLQEWTNLSERGSKEYNNKMNFIARMKKHNSSIGTTGERVLAPDGYYYLPGKVVEGTLKYEHLKSSSEQSFESLALIANNSWTTKGKEGLKKYKGIWGMLKDFNTIDKQTGATNSAGIHRLAESLELAKNIYSVESNLNRTLYQDIVRDVGIKEVKRILKADKDIGNATIKKLKNLGLASKDLSRRDASEKTKLVDKALEFGRKRNKKARGMSTWDFDDTLATTKSGVRARIPNIDGKPKPNRKVIFLAGGAGSGKGNVIKKLNLEKQGFKIVNSDISLEWLKKNNGLPENMNDLTKEQRSKLGSLQHQARGIAKRKMMKYKGNADGVVVDGTGGSIKSMEALVKEFKDKGYDVSMLFVETSLETALARNKARAERSLLDKIVEKNHEAVQGNKSGFKTMFGERFMEVKTDKLKQEDAMPTELVAKMKDFVSGYEKIRLDAEQFATEGQKILDKGGKFDFSEFNVVTEGAQGPFFQKAMARAKKFGTENQFVLTARPPEAARPIYEFLKSQGLEIPLENITGLGNSTGEAKAMWMLEKFAEGYNDMYFADDAIQNVKAVRNVLNQLDIKSKVQQALASKDLGKEVNNIMEHSLDIGSEKVFSKAEAKVRGKDIKRRRVFMRDSAADLELLIEPLYGKGKEGIKNKKWFKENLVMPFERGIRDYNTARQSAKNDYMGLRKQNKDVVKEISKPVEGTAFTNDMAMRVYLWNKAGYKIPDLAKTTEAKLVEHIRSNPKLQAYAESFARITKQEKGLKEPGENWWGETMAGEVTNINRGVSRKQYLQEWIDVKNEIFTEANLNKMESKLGTEWRENITDMFDRMETGRTRSLKMDRGSAAMMNYLNGGIGTIMNFNTRSAVLQTISTTNFLNMRENNPIAAARAMGNVKQFAKDFKYIMNSDMLKQRRDGLAMNVTEAEIASAAASSKNPVQSIISKVLKAGYLPTKMADSFAISFGGATFYRNRIKMYEKQGMETKQAEKQAFLDFQVIAERTQQSSRADLLSKQQTSLIGRFILPFANTPMQMNRAGMKDILDISKGRYKNSAEVAEKVGRISYYMGAQVAIFAGLQSALFAMLLNDDDVPEEKIANTKSMMLNTTADSMLRGFGIQGAVMSATKNALQEYFKQSAKPGFTADYSEVAEDLLNISPPIGSKFGMLDRAGDRKKWAKIKKNNEFKFELGNPSLEASLMTIQATTNAPVYSPYQNLFNMSHALSDQYETWQRVLMGAGWTPYSVGVETEDKKKKKKVKKSKTFKAL